MIKKKKCEYQKTGVELMPRGTSVLTLWKKEDWRISILGVPLCLCGKFPFFALNLFSFMI